MIARRCFSTDCILTVAIGLTAAALWIPFRTGVAAARPPEESAAGSKAEPASEAVTDWKEDPVCRMVFFAVLEGLYADGVPNEVVSSLVPKPEKEGDNPVKANFVAECPLCHPVYEALSLYQRRGAFRDGDGKQNTLGKGIDEVLQKRLLSDKRQDRLEALRVLVQRWVERRMTLMRLSDKERLAWTEKLTERSRQGKQFLIAHMREDPEYREGWSVYWGCAACNGTTDACRALIENGGKK